MFPQDNQVLCMTQVFCTMQSKWTKHSSHILHKVACGNYHYNHICFTIIVSANLLFFNLCLDKYYVVDARYPNRPEYLSPYKGERCHMPEWHRGMVSKTPIERFNRIHSSIQNVIERSFGLLKIKWQILYMVTSYSIYKQKMIVVTTMVLHNLERLLIRRS